MTYSPLIHGKNNLENVVSVEVTDNTAEIFLEKDGVITSQFMPQKFWLLAPNNLGSGWIRLKGDLHYKWGKQYSSREEFSRAMNYLRAKDVYTVWDPKESFMLNYGITSFKGMKPTDVSILSFDIETDGLKHTNNSRVYLISNTFRSQGKIVKKLFCYDEYKNDGEMIAAWCEWVREMNPSILTGHNIESYDFPYLSHTAGLHDVELNLGRDGCAIKFAKKESKYRVDGSRDLHYKKVRCYGREIIDTQFLAYKYDAVARKYQSYGLKPIIKAENLEKPGRVFYDASKIRDNIHIPEERVKIKEYAKDDADDALALFDLMTPSQFYLANSVPKSFQTIVESATGSQINSVLVRSYLQQAHSVPKTSELTERVEGGISFAIPGVYKNVLKVDLKSAYPSQVLRFKLYDPVKDPQAHFLKMVEHFAEERFELKRKYKETGDNYYKDRDGTAKIFLNSCYGVTNTPGLNFNSIELAKKITGETRQVLRMAIEWASGRPTDYWIQKFEEATK